jgi:hypothetical protein
MVKLMSPEAVTASAFGTAGNFTLPEPAIINAYLRTNTSLRNHLLPSNPPLQLIKCEVYLLQMKGLFNFYTADHQGGCAEVPGMKRKPYEAYSEREKFWLFQLRSSLCSWPTVLALVAVNVFYIYCLHSFDRNFFDIIGYWQRPRRSACEDFASRIAAGGALVFWCESFIVGLILAIVWDEIYVPHPLHLPDPASSINPFLRSSSISLSVQRCTVAPPDADEYFFYDFYTGMPDSLCPQIQAARALYPDQEVALLEQYKYKDSIDLSGVRFWLAVLHWASSSATLWGLALLPN